MLVERSWSWWRCWWNILGAGGDVGGTYIELVEMLVEHTRSMWRCWWNILGTYLGVVIIFYTHFQRDHSYKKNCIYVMYIVYSISQ